MLTILLLFGCSEPIDDGPISPLDAIKIEEVYYTGSVPTAGIDRYYADQFIQLRNVSTHTVDIGGMGLGDVHGLAGEINSGYGPNSFASDDENIYFSNMWQVPLESEHRFIAPGGCIKIAQNAADHSPYSTLSHFDAHFETYVEISERDTDDPIVENLSSIFYSAGFDWLITVFGPTIVLVDAKAISEGEIQIIRNNELWVTSSSHVIDTMEALMDADSEAYKRLPMSVDMGFQFASGTYTGESVRRVKEDGQWIDNNDSTSDYFITSPIADCSADQ